MDIEQNPENIHPVLEASKPPQHDEKRIIATNKLRPVVLENWPEEKVKWDRNHVDRRRS